MEVSIKFLYLGSRFVKETVTIPKYLCRPFISSSVAMRYLSEDMSGFIRDDVSLFKSNFKVKTKDGQDGFQRVNGKVYMYQPGIHIALSSVKLSDLAKWGVGIQEISCKEISVCSIHLYHDFLLPFSLDNTTLLLKNAEISASNDERAEANRERFEMLNAIKNDGQNHTHTPYHCSGFPFRTESYQETEWTIRLFHSLKGYIPPTFKINLTYDSGKDFVVFQKQYSKCGESGYYLFQGAPEIVLFRKDAMDAGASLMLNEVDVIEVKRSELHHTKNSTAKSEAGQLIACLHMFCVALMLRKIMADSDTLPTSVHSKGILMSRNNEVLIITLTIPVGDIYNCEEAKVEMVELKCTGSREELVCSAVGYLCNPSNFTIRELD